MEENIFEKIRHKGQEGREYWLARKLACAKGYKDYRNFKSVVEKAISLCRSKMPMRLTISLNAPKWLRWGLALSEN